MLIDLFQADADIGGLSVSCLSDVERDGNDESDEIHQRPALRNVMATVESSSESVGEPANDLLKEVSTLRLAALQSRDFRWNRLRNRRHLRAMKGGGVRELREPHPLQGLCKNDRLWLGILTTFCTDSESADVVEIGG